MTSESPFVKYLNKKILFKNKLIEQKLEKNKKNAFNDDGSFD